MSLPGYRFRGARITNLEWNSPLRRLNLRVGDAVTRLDGLRVTTGAYRTRDPMSGEMVWAMPQMERHFDWTQVRYVRNGSVAVNERGVDLGRLGSTLVPAPGPLIP